MRHLAVCLASMLVCACEPSASTGTSCELNSDCLEPLVCRYQRCRTACREARDCGPGLRCVAGPEGVSVCSLPQESACSAREPCPGSLLCESGECRNPCTSSAQCALGGVCVEGSCDDPVDGPPPACEPGPLVCGDGVLQGCETPERRRLLHALTGATTGELALLEPFLSAEYATPLGSGDRTLAPQIAVAIAGEADPGFALLGALEGGAAVRPHLRRFALDRLTGATDVDAGPDALGLRSIALGEDGAAVRAFYVHSPPSMGGEISALLQRIDAAGAVLDEQLLAGSPPNETWGRAAMVGGTSAMFGTTAEPFSINRELLPPAMTPLPIIGAVPIRSTAEYRVVETTAFSGSDYVELTGGPGWLAGALNERGQVALWRPSSLPNFLGPDDLSPLSPLATLPSATGPFGIAPDDSVGDAHLVAVPSARGVEVFRVECRESCSAPTPVAVFELGSGADAARVGRVRGGHVVVLREGTGEGRRLNLRVLDADRQHVPLFDDGTSAAPLLDVDLGAVGDVQLHASRSGGAVVVLVAALVRAPTGDRVWLGGYRACEAR